MRLKKQFWLKSVLAVLFEYCTERSMKISQSFVKFPILNNDPTKTEPAGPLALWP